MADRRLTRRQQARIQRIQEQRRQRAEGSTRHTETSSQSGLGIEQTGQVIANYGSALIIEDHEGGLQRCTVRQNLGTLACGDRVIWQAGDASEGVVSAVLQRRSLLTRPDYNGRPKPVAANLDLVAVVVASRPELNEFLIDRYLVAIATIGVDSLVVVNKTDLLAVDELAALETRLSTYWRIGYPLLFASARLDHGLDTLRARLKDHTSILVGQSGVGKSSLVKALLPDLEIRIQALSMATGQGTHTTTTSTLYHLPDGGDLIDSPGVRSFELGDLPPDDLERGFVEFSPYLGRCRFSNCSHTVEPGCALLAAVAQGKIDSRRLQSYHQLKLSRQK